MIQIDFEKIREPFLPEHRFSGKNQHHKSKYAITAAAMIHGGVYPDLLDDAAWLQTDDLWVYSFFALLIFMRAAAKADRTLGRRGRHFDHRSPDGPPQLGR